MSSSVRIIPSSVRIIPSSVRLIASSVRLIASSVQLMPISFHLPPFITSRTASQSRALSETIVLSRTEGREFYCVYCGKS